MNKRKPALVFIFITLFLDILGIGLIIPILPRLIEQLGGGRVDSASFVYGWLVGLYSLLQFLFAPIIGALSDLFGLRRFILLSLLWSCLDYFLLASSPTLVCLFVCLLLSGIT